MSACLLACLCVLGGARLAGHFKSQVKREARASNPPWRPTLATHLGGGRRAGDPKLLSKELPAKFKIWARMRPNLNFTARASDSERAKATHHNKDLTCHNKDLTYHNKGLTCHNNS